MGYLDQLKQHRETGKRQRSVISSNERNEKTRIHEGIGNRPSVPMGDERNEIDEESLCSVKDCAGPARHIEVGARAVVRLCRVHRRELYERARAISDRFGLGIEPDLEPRLCHLCGNVASPEVGCLQCADSPLVAMALRLGARRIDRDD